MKTDLISEDRKVYNRGFLKQAVKLAETGQCSSVLFFRDTFADPNTSFDIKTSLKLITVTQHALESSREGSRCTLSVRLFSEGRLTQLRSALLLGLMHGYVKADERICCIGGLPTSDRLDTVILLEVQREIQPIFAENNDLLPSEVRPEVFERVLSLATELATEGREGHAVGCLFVLGNVDLPLPTATFWRLPLTRPSRNMPSSTAPLSSTATVSLKAPAVLFKRTSTCICRAVSERGTLPRWRFPKRWIALQSQSPPVHVRCAFFEKASCCRFSPKASVTGMRRKKKAFIDFAHSHGRSSAFNDRESATISAVVGATSR